MKTYIVTVDIKESHTYEVKANSEAEAYEKIDGAELYEPSEPVTVDDGSAIPGVKYIDCEIWEKEVATDVREVGA